MQHSSLGRAVVAESWVSLYGSQEIKTCPRVLQYPATYPGFRVQKASLSHTDTHSDIKMTSLEKKMDGFFVSWIVSPSSHLKVLVIISQNVMVRVEHVLCGLMCLNIWSPVVWAILRGCRTFRKWGLTGGSGVLIGLVAYRLVLFPSGEGSFSVSWSAVLNNHTLLPPHPREDPAALPYLPRQAVPNCQASLTMIVCT